MHKWGPYNNVVDKKVSQCVGSPLLLFSPVLKAESVMNATIGSGGLSDHQESWSPTSRENNKDIIPFDKYMGFVTEPTMYCNLPAQLPLDMNDPQSYLRAVDLISASGLPNYRAVRIPLPSAFDLEYLEQQMVDYHDKVVLDYITLGFPLGIARRSHIVSNATENHASAKAYSDEVSSFISDELALMRYWALLNGNHTLCLPGHHL